MQPGSRVIELNSGTTSLVWCGCMACNERGAQLIMDAAATRYCNVRHLGLSGHFTCKNTSSMSHVCASGYASNIQNAKSPQLGHAILLRICNIHCNIAPSAKHADSYDGGLVKKSLAMCKHVMDPAIYHRFSGNRMHAPILPCAWHSVAHPAGSTVTTWLLLINPSVHCSYLPSHLALLLVFRDGEGDVKLCRW